MNRTDRLFAILLHIQANPRVRSADLAERFDVTIRTVYRDVGALLDAGVPVKGKAGEGYSIGEGYFLPPISFTRDEALMLVLGAGAVAAHFDGQYKTSALSAGQKIQASLPPPQRREVAELKTSMRFYLTDHARNPEERDALSKIRRAIGEKKRVAFRYFKKKDAETAEPMVREVDPYALTNVNGIWMLTGFDRLRETVRTFRLSRMEALLVTSKTFVRPRDFKIADLINREGGTGVIYTVRVDASIIRWVEEYPPYRLMGKKKEKQSWILRIESQREADVIAWVLHWGDHAELLAPGTARDKVRETIKTVTGLYEPGE